MQDDVQRMADEVAQLMVLRFGGARASSRPDLATMVRRRGGALPRRQRKAANRLAALQRKARSPRLARQIDTAPAIRDHQELMKYLRPLGLRARWQARAINILSAVMLGVLVVGALAIWLMVQRGLV